MNSGLLESKAVRQLVPKSIFEDEGGFRNAKIDSRIDRPPRWKEANVIKLVPKSIFEDEDAFRNAKTDSRIDHPPSWKEARTSSPQF